MVADEAIWNKPNTELENKVFVFIMVDSAKKREMKKIIVEYFLSIEGDQKVEMPIDILNSKLFLLEHFGDLPENGFLYLIDVSQLYRIFKS